MSINIRLTPFGSTITTTQKHKQGVVYGKLRTADITPYHSFVKGFYLALLHMAPGQHALYPRKK